MVILSAVQINHKISKGLNTFEVGVHNSILNRLPKYYIRDSLYEVFPVTEIYKDKWLFVSKPGYRVNIFSYWQCVTTCISKIFSLAPNQLSRSRPATGLWFCRMSPGTIIVVLFWTKCVVPRQVKPRNFKWSIKRDQSNLSIFFIFV